MARDQDIRGERGKALDPDPEVPERSNLDLACDDACQQDAIESSLLDAGARQGSLRRAREFGKVLSAILALLALVGLATAGLRGSRGGSPNVRADADAPAPLALAQLRDAVPEVGEDLLRAVRALELAALSHAQAKAAAPLWRRAARKEAPEPRQQAPEERQTEMRLVQAEAPVRHQPAREEEQTELRSPQAEAPKRHQPAREEKHTELRSPQAEAPERHQPAREETHTELRSPKAEAPERHRPAREEQQTALRLPLAEAQLRLQAALSPLPAACGSLWPSAGAAAAPDFKCRCTAKDSHEYTLCHADEICKDDGKRSWCEMPQPCSEDDTATQYPCLCGSDGHICGLQMRCTRGLCEQGRAIEPCADSAGWKDAFGHSCERYYQSKWCTAEGAAGEGWKSSWGTFEDFRGVDGVGPTQACCGCGRQR